MLLSQRSIAGSCSELTYVVIAILDKESNALAIEVFATRSFKEPVSRATYIAEKLSVLESPPGEGVDDGFGLGVMLSNGLEER
jgi:hypothetical protein